MRRCCPKCGSKNLKSRNMQRTRQVETAEGIENIPYGPIIGVQYVCICGWVGTWNELSKKPSRKSERRAKQLARREG